ncbi:MAG: nucleotidyltransferase domain-containing protein [Alphaproteobacteria bacterium]|nr:nucleotidyltransferase domain-containing protein [Alphaproteobacteria bacterium]MBQ8347091.1 nucleotidyltransferase domain-containing protein [Alphaproteobacteria bacterium]
MPESKDIDLTAEQLRIIRNFLQKHIPGVRVWAYGSRVKKTSTPKSDLDMVVFGDVEPRLPALRETFDESSLPFRVDLFAWNKIPEQFHLNIEENYFELQSETKK